MVWEINFHTTWQLFNHYKLQIKFNSCCFFFVSCLFSNRMFACSCRRLFHFITGTVQILWAPARAGWWGVSVLSICWRHLNLIAGPCRSINNYCKQFFMKYFSATSKILRRLKTAEKRRINKKMLQNRSENGVQRYVGWSGWPGCCQRQLKPTSKNSSRSSSTINRQQQTQLQQQKAAEIICSLIQYLIWEILQEIGNIVFKMYRQVNKFFSNRISFQNGFKNHWTATIHSISTDRNKRLNYEKK